MCELHHHYWFVGVPWVFEEFISHRLRYHSRVLYGDLARLWYRRTLGIPVYHARVFAGSNLSASAVLQSQCIMFNASTIQLLIIRAGLNALIAPLKSFDILALYKFDYYYYYYYYYNYKNLSCCYDSRSYCVRRTVYR